MTDTYRYKLNEYSHKVFERLFFKFNPIMRRSGKWDDTDRILQSELYSNEAFASASVDEIRKELDISDVLMQDVCEYMEARKHIDVTQRLTTGIIQKIRATKLGFQAYKFETYLAKNDTLIYQHRFRSSALWNNILTPIVAVLTLVISAVTLITQRQQSTEAQVKQEQFQRTIQTLDSSRRAETNALNAILSNYEKSFSKYFDTTKQKTQTK